MILTVASTLIKSTLYSVQYVFGHHSQWNGLGWVDMDCIARTVQALRNGTKKEAMRACNKQE